MLTPFDVGASDTPFDLLVVDEAHRLNQRANQASGPLNKKFAEINEKLFGYDDPELTQLDWIRKQSTHTVLMLDPGQRVRPADLDERTTSALLTEVDKHGRLYPLRSQMRISAAQDYGAPGSVQEVGSIHTVQGYDLNYAGVIIGKDLRYNPLAGRIVFDRAEYHDKKGRENNPKRGIVDTDDDLLQYVRNIYTVLLTRGILGTYVYVCDPALRDHLERYF